MFRVWFSPGQVSGLLAAVFLVLAVRPGVAVPALGDLSFAPLTVGVGPNDQLVLRGYWGRVRFVGQEKAAQLSIRVVRRGLSTPPDFVKTSFDEWQFSYVKDGSTLRAEILGPAEKKVWNQYIQARAVPEFDLEIRGRPIPVNLTWLEGTLVVEKWTSPLAATWLTGKVLIRESAGALTVENQSGEITVEHHTGPVNVVSDSAQITMRHVKGPMTVENFAGPVEIFENKGGLALKSYEGNSNVVKSEGPLSFLSHQAMMSIRDFTGDLRGEARDGQVRIQTRGPANVRVSSQSAGVSVTPEEAAWVHAATEEGLIFGPSSIKTVAHPTLKVRQGNLRGQAGRIYVKTKTGDIRIQ